MMAILAISIRGYFVFRSKLHEFCTYHIISHLIHNVSDLEKKQIPSAKIISYLLHQQRVPQKSEKDATLNQKSRNKMI